MITKHVITARARCWELCQQLTTIDQKLLLMEINAAINAFAEEASLVSVKKRDGRDGPTRAANDRTLFES